MQENCSRSTHLELFTTNLSQKLLVKLINILQNNGGKVVVKKQNPIQYQSYKQWRNPDANVF